MRIDAHQHFWHYNAQEYDWIGENEAVIRRDFLPTDLQPALKSADIDGCVAVQARQCIEETTWLLELAQRYDFVKGVVGWVDLRADDLALQLEQFQGNDKLKGFRHVVQGESDPNFMLQPEFMRGLDILATQNYCYDILIFSNQLQQALGVAKAFPNLPLVVDHIAKPDIKKGSNFEQWANDITALALFENVMCKVSGMVTEANVEQWSVEDFTPYLAKIFDVFGPERVMFGSDWPVCLLGGEYPAIKHIVEQFVVTHYPAYFEHVFGKTAQAFYRIS